MVVTGDHVLWSGAVASRTEQARSQAGKGGRDGWAVSRRGRRAASGVPRRELRSGARRSQDGGDQSGWVAGSSAPEAGCPAATRAARSAMTEGTGVAETPVIVTTGAVPLPWSARPRPAGPQPDPASAVGDGRGNAGRDSPGPTGGSRGVAGAGRGAGDAALEVASTCTSLCVTSTEPWACARAGTTDGGSAPG